MASVSEDSHSGLTAPSNRRPSLPSKINWLDRSVVIPPKLDTKVNFGDWLVSPYDTEHEGRGQERANSLTNGVLSLQQPSDISKNLSNAEPSTSQAKSHQSGAASSVATPKAPQGEEQNRTLSGSARALTKRERDYVVNNLPGRRLEEYFPDVEINQVNRVARLALDQLYKESQGPKYPFAEYMNRYSAPNFNIIQDEFSDSDSGSDDEYQISDTGSEDGTPTDISFHNTPKTHRSTPNIKRLLDNTWANSSGLFDKESPNLKKRLRNMASSQRLNALGLESQLCIQSEEARRPTRESKEKLTREEMASIGNSYVSQNYYPPSSTSIILPLLREIPDELRPWLNDRIEKRIEAKISKGFNSPQVLRYEPLGDLSEEEERHESERCLRAAKLIFEQDLTGTSDEPYDHGMAGVYHFIPKLETDKWNDDSNFVVTDQEFDDLIDAAFDGKEKPSEEQKPKSPRDMGQKDDAYIDTQYGYEFYGPNLEESDGSATMDTESCGDEAIYDEMELCPSATHSEKSVEQDTTRSETSSSIISETGFSTDLKRARPLTPTFEGPKQAARFETTSTHSHEVDGPVGSANSIDSFRTACESPQFKDQTSGSTLRPIPTFHTDRPSPSDWRGHIRRSSQNKSTKSVFALVGERREVQEDTGPRIPPSSNRNWAGTPLKLRPLQPSPVDGYLARSSQYDTGEPICSPPTPTPAGPRRARQSSSTVSNATHQISQSFVASPSTPPKKSEPAKGWFYLKPGQKASEHVQYGSAAYHANALGGYQAQLGLTQADNNGLYGQFSLYGNQLQSPGNWSSDSTISMVSPFNSTSRPSGAGYQPETPSRNQKKRKHMASEDGQFPGMTSPSGLPAKRSMQNPMSDPRTPRVFDSSPIGFKLPTPKTASREKVMITFQGHHECVNAQDTLKKAAEAAPEKKISFLDTLDIMPTTIIMTGVAGNNIRGWAKALLPDADVAISMV